MDDPYALERLGDLGEDSELTKSGGQDVSRFVSGTNAHCRRLYRGRGVDCLDRVPRHDRV
jgi:hypothetical protein